VDIEIQTIYQRLYITKTCGQRDACKNKFIAQQISKYVAFFQWKKNRSLNHIYACLQSTFLFCVMKVISYNEYIGPYSSELNAESMKFWNQDNETCKYQYDSYGELACK